MQKRLSFVTIPGMITERDLATIERSHVKKLVRFLQTETEPAFPDRVQLDVLKDARERFVGQMTPGARECLRQETRALTESCTSSNPEKTLQEVQR